MLTSYQFDLLLQLDVCVQNLTPYDALKGLCVRVENLYANGFSSLVVVGVGEFGCNKGVTQLDIACAIETDAFPDARVTVANAVLEGEVPADGHQLTYVLSHPSVSSVMPLTCSTP